MKLMGYMTTITILNDRWSDIEKNPEQFLENIQEGMNGYGAYFNESKSINYYSFGVRVAKSHHADYPHLYMAFGNSMIGFGYGNDITDVELRKKYLKMAKDILKAEQEEIKRLEKESKDKEKLK
jgi:hypothetical protein